MSDPDGSPTALYRNKVATMLAARGPIESALEADIIDATLDRNLKTGSCTQRIRPKQLSSIG